jgi:hypothetical protein
MATNFPGSLDILTNPTSGNTLDSPSHSLQHADANDAIEAIEAKLGIGTATAASATSGQVLTKGATNTTWASISSISNATISGGTAFNQIIISPEETVNIVATASSGTVNADFYTAGVTFGTANATANWVMNLRGDSTTTVNSLIAVGQSISHVYMNTNGGTAFYPTSFTVDGTAITPRWQAAGTPTSGNINSIDAYAFTLIKTAVTPTYTLLASQTRFA